MYFPLLFCRLYGFILLFYHLPSICNTQLLYRFVYKFLYMKPINHLHGTWKARFRNLLHAPGHIQCNFFDLITQLLWHLCKYRNDIIGFSALNYSYNRTFPTSLISIY